MTQRGGSDTAQLIEGDREFTGPISFATSASGPQNLDASLDMVIDNGGTTNHTLTLTIRGGGGTITRQLPAKTSLPIPCTGIQGVALDTTDANVTGQFGPRGSIQPFRSAPGGAFSLLPASVATTELGNVSNNNAGAAFQQAGFGSVLKLTPTVSGKVLLVLFGTFEGGAGGNLSEIKGSFGTGAAPVLHAAVAGTAIGLQELAGLNASGNDVPFCLVIVIGGLTLGTAYWFDAQIFSNVNAIGFDVWGSVQELPA